MIATIRCTALLLLLVLLYGCSESADVYDTSPRAGAVGVPQDTTITVHFSHSMDAETVNEGTFHVYGTYYGGYYPGDITSDEEGKAFTFTLSTRDDGSTVFIPGEKVTVTLTSDIIGTDNIPYDGKTFSFTVAGEVPDMYLGPIKVTATYPESGDSNVPFGQTISVTFTRNVDQESLEGGYALSGSISGSMSAAITLADNTETGRQQAVFVPDSPFVAGETVQLFLSGSVHGIDELDTLAAYGLSYTVASGSASGPWQAFDAGSGVTVRDGAVSEFVPAASGLEGLFLDADGKLYVISPESDLLKVSPPFEAPSGVFSAVAAADPLGAGQSEMFALASIGATTEVLFLEPAGMAGLEETEDPLQIEGRFGSVMTTGYFDADRYLDIVLGGPDGLLLIGREEPEEEETETPDINDIMDAINNGDDLDSLTGGVTAADASFVILTDAFPSLANVHAVLPCDLNNDGRADLVVQYEESLGFLLWEDDGFGALNVLSVFPDKSGFTVMHTDDDLYPEVIACFAGGQIALFKGTAAGPGARQDITLPFQLPAVSLNNMQIRSYDLTGDGLEELILGAADWDDLYILSPEQVGGTLLFSLETIMISGLRTLHIADVDLDTWPELLVSNDSGFILFNSDSGPGPVSVASLALREEHLEFLDDNTIRLTVSGGSSMEYDGVRMGIRYDPDMLEFVSADFPAESYFDSENAALDVCSTADGCDDRVMATLTMTEKAFTIHDEVLLASFTFRNLSASGGFTLIWLANELENADGEVLDNAFHAEAAATWITASLTEPEIVASFEGDPLDLACTLETNQQGSDPAATLTWSSPGGDPLSDLVITRNGIQVHTASGSGSWTDTGVETGSNQYTVSLMSGGVAVAQESCELFYVAPPVLVSCFESDGELVVQWEPADDVDGVKIWRDGGTSPVYIVYDSEVTEYREDDDDGGTGHLFSVSAFLEGHESARVSCEQVIGGNQLFIELMENFTAAVDADDAFTIDLSWTQGTGYEEIAVFRNSVEIDRIGFVTSYTDALLPPGQYIYKLYPIARGELKEPVTAMPVTVDIPLCTGLSCSASGEGIIDLSWSNGAAAYDHFQYDAVILQRTWISPEGVEQSLSNREIPDPAAVSYTDTISEVSGTYRYRVVVRYNGEIFPAQGGDSCEVTFKTDVYPLPVLTGAGFDDVSLPVKADLVGSADEVRFTFRYYGFMNRLQVTGSYAGPGLSVDVSAPETQDGMWYSSSVVVHGPVPAGNEVHLCSFLASTAASFALYGYDTEPPDENKSMVSLVVDEIEVDYTGGVTITPDPGSHIEQVTVSCRNMLAGSAGGLSVGDTFTAPIYGTFDQNILGLTIPVAFDPDVLECIGVSLDNTEIPTGFFEESQYDNENGTILIAWIAAFQPANPIPSGINRHIANLLFRVVGSSTAGEEIRIETIQMNDQTHRPLLQNDGWNIGEYLETTFGGEVATVSAPVISSLGALEGPFEGGNRLEVSGLNFGAAPPEVTIGGSSAQVLEHSDTSVLCEVPQLEMAEYPDTPVSVSVTLHNANGSDTLEDGYTYTPLSVTSVEPELGSMAGGTQVRITGRGMGSGLSVFFGSNEAQVTGIDQFEGTYVQVDVPASQVAEAVDVRCVAADGREAVLTGGYTYVAPAPEILSLTPESGAASGGTRVVIQGSGFLSVQSVEFGGVPAAEFVVLSTQQIEAISPAGDGSVQLTVTTATGQASAAFLYQAREVVISNVDPLRGTAQGGTSVFLMGQGFTVDTQVLFGGNAAASIVVLSDMALRAETPAGTGDVLVEAGNPGGEMYAAADMFSYVDTACEITAFQPASGPSAGGNEVEITGANFIPETSVLIAGTAVLQNHVDYVDQNTLRVVMPAGTGIVTVSVRNPGTDPVEAASTYEYETPQVVEVTAIAPLHGSRFGGTTMTITGSGFGAELDVFLGDDQLDAAGITVVSETTVEVVMPEYDPGQVAVSVRNPGGELVEAPDAFTFDPFAVSSLAPQELSLCGAEEVVIEGTSFMEGVGVSFGSYAAVQVTVSSETELRVTTPEVPEGTGIVQVVLSFQGLETEGASVTFSGPDFIRGDVNDDGRITTNDAYLIRDYVNGLKTIEVPLDAADANDDGIIDMDDLNYLFNYLYRGGTPPPAPFPDPGTDPTPDEIPNC